MSITGIAPQLPDRREAVLGMLFVLFLVMGVTLWDEVAFTGQPLTQSSWIGLAISAGACLLVLAFSRRKWPLLLCAVLLAAIRIPNVWLGSPFPESLGLLADCFAVSISLFAVFFRTEIAGALNRVRAI
jgi:predicted cobalt transporter CbtA